MIECASGGRSVEPFRSGPPPLICHRILICLGINQLSLWNHQARLEGTKAVDARKMQVVGHAVRSIP